MLNQNPQPCRAGYLCRRSALHPARCLSLQILSLAARAAFVLVHLYQSSGRDGWPLERCFSAHVGSGLSACQSGMTVIVTDTDGAWRMADVIWVDGGARNPKIPTLFQVADVDTGVINWVNADFVTHIVPRV